MHKEQLWEKIEGEPAANYFPPTDKASPLSGMTETLRGNIVL